MGHYVDRRYHKSYNSTWADKVVNWLQIVTSWKCSLKISNLAAFIRSFVGLNQDAVNKKFGEYLNSNTFNSQQQEFIHTIINYVRENGDIELSDIVNTEPFNNYDINEMFGTNINAVVEIVNVLHGSVTTDVA